MSRLTNRVVAGSSSWRWRAMNARMPSWSVSSAPQETSSTRRPGIGPSRRSSASATSEATPERLSLAPWTVSLRQMSATSAVPSTPRTSPARAPPRRRRLDPRSALSSVASGPASPNHHCGRGVLKRSRMCGARWWSLRWRVWSKRPRSEGRRDGRSRPAWSMRRGSPARAIRLTVVRRRRTRRRRTRGPLWASSTIPANVTAASSAPSRRRPRRLSRAARMPARPPPVAVGGKVPQEGSSSSSAAIPGTEPRRACNHSAAWRSPGEQGERSSGASVSTTSRRMASMSRAEARSSGTADLKVELTGHAPRGARRETAGGREVDGRRERSQKALSLTAICRHLLHDPLAFEQMKAREALAQLARLGVAQPDAIAHRETVRGVRRAAASAPRRPPPDDRAATRRAGAPRAGARRRRDRTRDSRRRAPSRRRDRDGARPAARTARRAGT